MTTQRRRNGYLHFSRKMRRKRKLTRRERTRRQRDETTLLNPILASVVAPVLTSIIRKIFRNDDLREKEKITARRKTKYRTQRRRYQKDGLIDPFAPFKTIGKMMSF